MYNTHFGLSETPFSITPDPRYLFMSQRHREALAHLLYGIQESGGFVLLTGEVGTGKTTVTRALLEQMPENVDVALVLNPCLTVAEFLACVCDELRIEYPNGNRSVKVFVDYLNKYLLDRHAIGRRVVVIVDEAQNLNPAVLEQVRLLTNLETTKEKLLQIILIGQPELNDLLARTELRQLAQRITARYHLKPLTPPEVARYVTHRLRVAGCGRAVFSTRAMRAIWRLSGGIPRVVNVICDRALLGAYAADRFNVRSRMVRRAAQEVKGAPSTKRVQPVSRQMVLAAVLAMTIVIALAAATQRWNIATWLAPNARTAETISSPPAATTAKASDFGSWLRGNPVSTNEESVTFADWLELWPTPLAESTATNCEGLRDLGWRCEFAKGSWETLLAGDRAVLLNLGSGDMQRMALLRRVIGDGVEILVAGKSWLISRSELTDVWSGDYVSLWKPPTGYTEPLKLGMEGAVVNELRKQIATIPGEGKSIKVSGDVFDQELADAVTQFQKTHHLNADGIAGEETLYWLFQLQPGAKLPTLK